MKTSIILVICMSIAILSGCSQESREKALERASNAASVLNGGDKSAEKEHKTPLIVQEQQKKEIIRQNTEWTAENQALHPIEYCQAKLTELGGYAERLTVVAHKLATEQNLVQRSIEENAKQTASLERFLTEAKSKYKAAEEAGKWPMELNGFMLSRETVQEKVIEADKKLQLLKAQEGAPKNNLTMLKKKQTAVADEQKRIELLKNKVQATIDDLRTKQIIQGENGITDALNALNASIGALSTDANNPELSDLLTPSEGVDREAQFNEIMKK